jgi:hypothetical protein
LIDHHIITITISIILKLTSAYPKSGVFLFNCRSLLQPRAAQAEKAAGITSHIMPLALIIITPFYLAYYGFKYGQRVRLISGLGAVLEEGE